MRTDEYCIAIGTDNVAAAGDIALYPHPARLSPICIEHWSNARDMGALAAANLLATRDARAGVRRRADVLVGPVRRQDQSRPACCGSPTAATVVEEDTETGPRLVVEAYRGDELVGAVVFNKNRTIIDYQRKLQDALLV